MWCEYVIASMTDFTMCARVNLDVCTNKCKMRLTSCSLGVTTTSSKDLRMVAGRRGNKMWDDLYVKYSTKWMLE